MGSDGNTSEQRAPCGHRRFTKRGTLSASVFVPRLPLRILLDYGASMCVVFELVMNVQTIFAIAGAIAGVMLWDSFGRNVAHTLTWTPVSFVLVFPLSNALSSAYNRREQALNEIMKFRSLIVQLYLSHRLLETDVVSNVTKTPLASLQRIWDWVGNQTVHGRTEDDVPEAEGGHGLKKKPFLPLAWDHDKRVHSLLLKVVDALEELLLVPRGGRPRHEFCSSISPQGEQVEAAELQGRETCVMLISRLHRASEELKSSGMPANETSRINQHVMLLHTSLEMIWKFQVYRTTTSLRAFFRVLVQFLPMFYGPYFLHIAKVDESEGATVGSKIFACTFASLISVLLVALFNLQVHMENPFSPNRCSGRDNIRVREEMSLCRSALATVAGDASLPWHQLPPFPWEAADGSSSEELSFAADDDDRFLRVPDA